MPVNLNNLLNSTPVSPPHSHFHPSKNQGPSAIELSNLLSPAVDTHRSLPNQQQQQHYYDYDNQPEEEEEEEEEEEDEEQKQFLEALQAPPPLTQPSTHTLPAPIFNRTRAPNQSKLTSYQRPIPFTSFSYDEHRLIRTGNSQFDSLRPFHVPHDFLGFDLAHRFDQAVLRDESIDEGIDGLLVSLIDFLDKADPKERLDICRGVLSAGLITWRGVLTKLCSTVYETGGEGERGGWTKEVMMVDGTVYVIDGPKTASEDGGSSAHQTYYGHSYESLVTNPDGFQDVNTNTQWVAVVKANLNGNRIILGGEVDCIDPLVFNQVHQQLSNPHPHHQSPPPIPIDHFVEIKTSVIPSSERDHWNLYRFKMLKFWLQSYLLGVPKIHVGLRDRSGIVRDAQDYPTHEIPVLVKQPQTKPGGRWSSELCLEGGGGIISFVVDRLRRDGAEGGQSRQRLFQARLETIIAQEAARWRAEGAPAQPGLSDSCFRQIASLAQWPVYSLRFRPAQNQGVPGTLELVESPAELVAQSVAHRMSDHLFGFLHPLSNPPHDHRQSFKPSRIGFLPSLWINYLVLTRVQLALESDPSSASRNFKHHSST
ncbi:uncharacterized protein PGTG_02354 [Puccinia graminis f. sp. tritici CRL 75-36-700-3]|uniref:Decapping nuclease n=1 Tax=Puccinia graminis f. sp. tritici (strain CRL 75-36-700-3 / race SCCL) TaxID=418459 RepID=E3JXW8_PUCGT|nr:uncharacterized protein PGTG_02354 [Puccinia graminis f. sp. tritici CRL 75-36-700-3]EFP76893.2 hypothetical protein PGTG_02354 [Puccinia graminis f. sp. tritici CRL 75-36-700-3]